MTDRNGPNRPPANSDLDALRDRIDAARKVEQVPDTTHRDNASALGVAWRLSTELVVSVLVGLGLGYGIDHWLGTGPWGLLIGLCLGFAAGVKTVLKSSEKLDGMNAGVPLGDDMPGDDDED